MTANDRARARTGFGPFAAALTGRRRRAKRVQRQLRDEAEDERVDAFLAALRATRPSWTGGK